MQKKYGPKGFTVISVSSDEKASEAGAFAKEIRATFPVVHDVKTTMSEKFGVEGLPANVLVDRKGKVIGSWEGSKVKEMEAAVAKAIGGK
jgi:cytochrome c biogenesis protein CcmG, thiol:disulfide interchange protein DsbE